MERARMRHAGGICVDSFLHVRSFFFFFFLGRVFFFIYGELEKWRWIKQRRDITHGSHPDARLAVKRAADVGIDVHTGNVSSSADILIVAPDVDGRYSGGEAQDDG